MDKDYNSIVVNQDIFTIDDAREAAKQLFEAQADDFYALKNEKWYKHFLNAITFGSDQKKKVIKDIRSLSKLQTIFMRIYYENYKGLDSQLNEIIDNIEKTNESVKKIFVNYIVCVKPQQSILDLPQIEQDILLLFLCAYSSNVGNDEKLKKFRAGVAQTIGRGIPQGKFNPKMLEQIKSGDVFYRFIVEMCAIDGGLDDFSVPDNIYEAIDYLTISNKAKQNIESQVRNELENFGTDYLIEKYGMLEENLINDDIELKDEDIVNEEEEFTSIIIDKELKIEKGKQKVYKNKEILIHANVICEGELLFDHCILKYNDSALSSGIGIKANGQLSITDCTIICLSYKENYFFECDGNVIIKHTKFLDCAYLFRVSKDFFVEQCEIVNCTSNLFRLSGYEKNKIIICNSKIFQSDLKQFYKENLERMYDAMIEVSYDCIVQFNNNIVIEKSGFSEIFKDKYNKFMYIESDETSITQSTFINTSGGIDASNIEECYFKECKNPIKNSIFTSESSKIQNCIFEECIDVISCRKNAEIRNCQFISCKNRLIDCDDASDGGVIVDSCTFKNIQNDFYGDDSNYRKAYDASALRFRRSKRGAQESKINNCNFDGIRMKKAFLIASEGYEKPKNDRVVSVCGCTFTHCVTQRKSKKLIREYFWYYGLFDKKKDVHAVNLSNCKGLDKINCEGSRPKNLSINNISTSGRKIGADLTLE